MLFPDLASDFAKAIVEYTYAISGKGARETASPAGAIGGHRQ
jgi:hypothetical protein